MIEELKREFGDKNVVAYSPYIAYVRKDPYTTFKVKQLPEGKGYTILESSSQVWLGRRMTMEEVIRVINER